MISLALRRCNKLRSNLSSARKNVGGRFRCKINVAFYILACIPAVFKQFEGVFEVKALVTSLSEENHCKRLSVVFDYSKLFIHQVFNRK